MKKEAASESVNSTGQNALRYAAKEALLVLAVLKITDADQPYAEISPTLRNQIVKAHDLLVSVLQPVSDGGLISESFQGGSLPKNKAGRHPVAPSVEGGQKSDSASYSPESGSPNEKE